MIVYILIFIFTIFIYLYYRPKGGVPRNVFFVMMLILALFVGLGDMLGGYDRYIYGELFDSTSNHIKAGGDIKDTYLLNFYSTEKGFGYLNLLITFITANRYIFILLITLIMYFLFYKTFIEETDNWGFALILFLGLYFFFTFTYLRQALAVALVGFSYRYVVRRNFLWFCVFMLLAASMHNSVLLFFPMYFLVGHIPSKSVILGLSLICLGIGLTGIPSNIFEVYQDVTEEVYRSASYINDDSGFRFIYILEAVVFLYFLLNRREKVVKNARNIIHYNTAFCFCLILLLFCQSLNGGRLAWPFILGLIFAITPSNNDRFRLKMPQIALICLSFILFIRIVLAWNILLSPYKTFLTPGVREGDYIHNRYEYDHRYDFDKFYR